MKGLCRRFARGTAMKVKETRLEKKENYFPSGVKYDLIGKIAENVKLTRKTVGANVTGIEKVCFDQFKTNPESFI